LDGAYYYHDRSRRDGWSRQCKACARGEPGPAKAAARARRRAGARAPEGTALLPFPERAAPSRPSFREVVEREAERQWPKLARKFVGLAAAGDKAMVRLLMAYLLGKPAEAPEDEDSEKFLRIVVEA
jgi:hypothetical protein